MTDNTHTIKRAIMGFALAAAVAAFVASSARASGGNSPSLSYTKASSTQTDGYAAVLERHFKHEDSLAGSSTSVTHARGGFNWTDAGIGMGAVFGLALIALGVGTVGGRAGRDLNIKKRRRLARSLERAAAPERPIICRGPRYIVQPSVAVACAPSLRAIATALRDETRKLDEHGLRAVLSFVTDGGSPFFGLDATEALREAVRLQHNVIGTETASLDVEPMAVAV